jgi:hypothetical protein
VVEAVEQRLPASRHDATGEVVGVEEGAELGLQPRAEALEELQIEGVALAGAVEVPAVGEALGGAVGQPAQHLPRLALRAHQGLEHPALGRLHHAEGHEAVQVRKRDAAYEGLDPVFAGLRGRGPCGVDAEQSQGQAAALPRFGVVGPLGAQRRLGRHAAVAVDAERLQGLGEVFGEQRS